MQESEFDEVTQSLIAAGLLEQEDPLCVCGHTEDDHSRHRQNICDLSFACRCQGFIRNG